MCRLFYVQNPKKLIEKYGEDVITDYLYYLIESAGGHGNGLGGLIINNGKEKFYIAKGLGLTSDKSVELMKKKNWVNGAIWHTRLSSSGGISSRLNHPFTDLDHILILAHNGHITYADTYLKILKMLDPRYKNYTYGYSTYTSYSGYYTTTYYKTTNNNKQTTTVNDTWILTNLIATLIKYSIISKQDIDRIMATVWKNTLSHDAVILQLWNGTVYLLVDRNDFEITELPEIGVVAASKGLSLLGANKILKGSGVIKIEPGKTQPHIVAGEFKEIYIKNKKKKKNKEKKGKIHETETPVKKLEEWFDTCYNECLDAGYEVVWCNRICTEIAQNVDDEEELWDEIYTRLYGRTTIKDIPDELFE